MTSYDTLKKIIPPDQALANEALKRSLGQVKNIFNTTSPELSSALISTETNKDLNLINGLTEPLPPNVANVYTSMLATGTGPGGSITTNDALGTAAGATHNVELPIVVNVLQDLDNDGQLDILTYDGGTATDPNNGVYTVMNYCLANAYTTADIIDPLLNIIDIPVPLPGAGTYGPGNISVVMDDAFGNGLIPAAANIIANIAAANPAQTLQANDSFNAMGNQLVTNANNLGAAGIDYHAIVNIGEISTTDPGNLNAALANANIMANSKSSVLSLTSRLHDIGLDIAEGGQAQFFEAVANTSDVGGQAVIASMREGRNIVRLSEVGINMDTQLSDVNPNTKVDGNLITSGQYSVTEARGNIII